MEEVEEVDELGGLGRAMRPRVSSNAEEEAANEEAAVGSLMMEVQWWVVLRLPTRETWREHTWWGGETWAGVVRSDWRGRGQAYEVAGRAAPASAAGTLPST